MQGNVRRDTAPELRVRRLLHAQGLRYRVDAPLPFDRRRRADITFPRARVVVFIDGCFWHACPEHYIAPKSHPEYWSPKIAANRARDAETTARLAVDGWTVLRFWEHEDPDRVADTIVAAVVGAASVGSAAAPAHAAAVDATPAAARRVVIGVLHGALDLPALISRVMRRPWRRIVRTDRPAGQSSTAT